jgi:hypothetical protein
MASVEYLEALMKETKKYVPKWLYVSLMKVARARAGGQMKAKRRSEKTCGDEEDHKKPVKKAVWTRAFINDLPDSAFLYVESGGEKDEDGKTVPRTLRHFPYRDSTGKVDLPHLRNALARIPQAKISQDEKDKARRKAQKILEQQKERMSKADVVFCVSSLEPVEKARQRPLVGDMGILFREKYVTPLGCTRDDDAVVMMTDVDELYDAKPRIIIALGKQAASELDEMVDIVMPHPRAIYKYDSGEVGNKCKKMRKLLLDRTEKEEYFFDNWFWLSNRPPEDQGNQVTILKADETKQIVYGVVMDPYGKNGPEADAHNDWTPPAEIEKTAHGFMKGSRVIGMQHNQKAEASVVESWVEPYPTRKDYLKAMNDEPHKVTKRPFGDDVLHSGAWVMGVQLGHDEWKAYERGDINAFSPGGFGLRTPLSPSMMPEVEFVEFVPKEKA